MMENEWIKRVGELEAERDTWHDRAIAVAAHLDYETTCDNIKIWVYEHKEKVRAIDKRIEELEVEVAKLTAERDADRRREYGYSQETVDALTAERGKLEAENKRLREAIKNITDDRSVCDYCDACQERQALKEEGHE